ncbi:DNRLRE domain-containing protein [bacterium]|nr:DNRLRE domain-containing protein [bacterium]
MMMSHFRILASLALAAIVTSAMPAFAATYYVSTASGASNSNTGTQDKPWRTITYAASKAVAGDTVYIKAGNYGNETVVVKNSGSSGKPITFEGYGGTVLLGTLPNPRTTPASTFYGFYMSGKNYITLRNLNFTYYFECVYVNSSDYVTLDNLYIDKCGGEGAYGDGIILSYADHCTITNCTVKDSGGDDVFLNHSNYNTIDNLKCIGTLASSDTYATDYYFVGRCSSYNTIKNCANEDTVSSKGNHGFIFKDLTYTPNSTGNVVQDCTAKNFEECFSVAHKAYGNTFLRCTADNSKRTMGYNACFQARNGAHDNTDRECNGTAGSVGVSLSNYAEGNTTLDKPNNRWINCLLKSGNQSSSIGIYFDRTSGTVFENCVFDKFVYFARYTNTNTAITLKNSILTGMTNRYDGRNMSYPLGGKVGTDGTSAITATYNDIFGNTFASFGGEGTISQDPLFASTTDYHLKSKAGRWNGSAWVQDAESSPCIDAGDQSSAYTKEPAPNGGRINIGRYGNTTEASKSSGGGPIVYPPSDNRLLERDPTIVYASNTFLDIGHMASNGKKYRDLIWFDLSQYHASVKQATLSLYWYFPSATRINDTIVDIYRPAAGWDHNTVCWNIKSGTTAWTNAGGDWFDKNGTAQGNVPYASITFSGSQPATKQFCAFDVTSLVNAYIQSGQNAGFFIKARTENDNYIALYALNATDTATRPKLTISDARNAAESWALYK